MKRSIVAIDAGYANFACVHINGDWRRPLRLTNERLLEGPFNEEALFEATYQWCQQNKAMLESCDAIVLERQMEKKFAVINTVIRTLHHDKTEERNPRSVGARFGLDVNDRPRKKRQAVELVKRNVPMLSRKKGKKDDMADAFLLAISYLQDHNPKSVCDFGQ